MQTEGHAMTRKQSIYSSLELCKSSSFLLLYLFSPLPFNTASFFIINSLGLINRCIPKILFYQKMTQTKERLNVSHCYFTRLNLKKWGLYNFASQSPKSKIFFQFLWGIVEGRTSRAQPSQPILKKLPKWHFLTPARDIHIECSKQFKWNLYFYGSGQSGPFWAELKLL